ncbi:hypothetical protein C8R44DRAFT_737133 [Mycena epipterygia]|nr:hypothetical protein C8R44DRAFT_737133 [Mycena epipterygia]
MVTLKSGTIRDETNKTCKTRLKPSTSPGSTKIPRFQRILAEPELFDIRGQIKADTDVLGVLMGWINPGLPTGHNVPSNSTLHRSRDVGEMGGEGWWLSHNKNPNHPGLACIKPTESNPTMVLCRGLLEAWVQLDNHHQGRRRLSPY